MANVKKSSPIITDRTIILDNGTGVNNKLGGLIPVRSLAFLIGFIAVIYYANSLGGTYVMDDAIVISENQYTVQGIKGWPGIFGHDTFYGFFKESGKDHLVAGGRYRPLSLALFALEGQIFGFKPLIFHLFNLLYFALACMLLFKLAYMLTIKKMDRQASLLIAFFTSLIFAVHPIHTEVVANIKGRDELLCCLFGMAAMYLVVKAVDTGRILTAITAALCIFLSMISKENGIVFVALTPLAVWFFTDSSVRSIAAGMLPVIIVTVLYLALRHAVLGSAPDTGPIVELMNNPFLRWEVNGYLPIEASQKFATISVTMLKYLMLTIFPHPLTSDYYPKQIAITGWGDWKALLGFIMYAGMIFIAIIRLKKKELPVYGILFYLIALFPMSNVIFPVGTLMSERFLFIPSIGICFIMAWFLCKYVVKNKITSPLNLGLLAIILILGVKTVARNKDWSDNFTLFTTDVRVSDNSAKMLNSAGGVLVDSAFSEKDPVVRKLLLDDAQGYLQKAIELHPSYANAYLLLGNTLAYKEDFAGAAGSYETALKFNPAFKDAKNNLSIAYREIGKSSGEKEGNLAKALQYLEKSLVLNPKDPETNRLMGVATGMSGKPQEALKFFQAALDAAPDNAFYMFDLGSAYANTGDMDKAKFYHAQAIKKDPSMQKRLNK